jgi:hypothetical protein
MDQKERDEQDKVEQVDVYSTVVSFGIPGFDVADANLAEHLEAVKADIERMQTLLADPDVALDWSDYDRHFGGSMAYFFETTSVDVAKKYEFEEVVPAGEEDSEPTPWSWAMQPASAEDRATLATMAEKATALGIDIEKAYTSFGLIRNTKAPETNGDVDRAYCALKYAVERVENAQAALKSAQATLAHAVRS